MSLGVPNGLGRKCRQDSRPGTGSFVEALHVVFLVWRVDLVVVTTKADQHRIHVQHLFEESGNWDGTTAANIGRWTGPFIAERDAGLFKGRVLDGHLRGSGPFFGAVLNREAFGQAAFQMGAEAGADFVRVLLSDETEGQFGGGLRGQHGFEAIPGVAAPDAVNVAGWT